MSGVIDLCGGARGAVAARSSTAYDLADSDTDEDEYQAARHATSSGGARARREEEIRARQYRSQVSGIAADGGWGSSARAAVGGSTLARERAAQARHVPAGVGASSALAAIGRSTLDRDRGAQTHSASAGAGASAEGAFGDIEHEEEACCAERCPNCLLCASSRPCHGRQICLCEKVQDSDGLSEEERREIRRKQKDREEAVLQLALQQSMAESQRAPPPTEDFDAQMAEAIRQSMEEARLQAIADDPSSAASVTSSAPAAAASRSNPTAGVKRPRADGGRQRQSKNARATQNIPPESSRRRAAADAADQRSAVAALRRELAEKNAMIARLSEATSPQSAPGSAPGSPSVLPSAEVLKQRQMQLENEQAQLKTEQAQLRRERLQLQEQKAELGRANSQLKEQQFKRKAEAYRHSVWSHRKLMCEMGKKDKKGVTFTVRRAPAHFLQDSCSSIAKLSKRQLMASPIWVKFKGEEGVDEGGVTREFWSMIGEMISPSSAANGAERDGGGDASGESTRASLFEQLSDEPGAAFLPAASKSDKASLDLFRGLGILMSRMLLDSAAPLDIAKASASCARPFESNFGLLCLRYFIWRDPELSERLNDFKVCHATADIAGSVDGGGIAGDLNALLSLVREGHGADSLASSMSALQSQPLPGDTTLGGLSLVDEDNNPRLAGLRLSDRDPATKKQAVIALLHHMLLGSRRKQLEALYEGFVYAGSLTEWWKQLRMFDDRELVELLWQPAEVDTEAVLSMLKFCSFEPSHRTPTWLRALLREASNDELRNFLRWCTGTAAISAVSTASAQEADVANLGPGEVDSAAAAVTAITVQWEPEYEGSGSTRSTFPTASTCARTVTLPEYETKEKLKEQLIYAMDEKVFRAQ